MSSRMTVRYKVGNFASVIIIIWLRSRQTQDFSNLCHLGLKKKYCLAAAASHNLLGGPEHISSTV